MRLVLSVALVGLLSTPTAFAEDGDASPVYLPHFPTLNNANCHTFSSETECKANHCTWCVSSAVKSSCYSEEEAKSLPPSIFRCDKTEETEGQWVLTSTPVDEEGYRSLFTAWKATHDKKYASDLENEKRASIFRANVEQVANHNSRNDVSYTLELNEFADTTWNEFQDLYLGAPQHCSATHASSIDLLAADVPEEKDWRVGGYVSPVKNQGKCGSCWSFSTTGCLESHVLIKHKKLVLLSEQNLMDCATNFDNHGCNGGLPSHAFEYVMYNGGLDTESTYPYEMKQGKCKFNEYHIGVQVDEVVNITSTDEAQLKTAVGSTGPVSVAFQVVDDFRFYKSGVYSSKECRAGEKDVNHAVLAVGYGTAADMKHWIVKNSWGPKWGSNGYFQIERGANMCGIGTCASYPVIHSDESGESFQMAKVMNESKLV